MRTIKTVLSPTLPATPRPRYTTKSTHQEAAALGMVWSDLAVVHQHHRELYVHVPSTKLARVFVELLGHCVLIHEVRQHTRLYSQDCTPT